ncbi:MAG: hypothetical protein E7471_04200 [Ruminococcaceae bacterium]|nr:hypothetical protein [Oscillospiraceae bacterium]
MAREGKRLKTLDPMMAVTSYFMPTRVGSSNSFFHSVEISECEEFICKKREEGLKGLGMMHLFLAAYARTVSQRPGLNRFVRGQRVYKRNNIVCCLTIKKEMALNAPETVVKLALSPTDTITDVYHKLNKLIEENRGEGDGNAMDKFIRLLLHLPGILFKFTVWLLKTMDYFGLLPRFLTDLSPFHGSLFITNLGSLGIPPVAHHLYDFGNVPLFIATGAKRQEYALQKDGSVKELRLMDFTLVCDERICDGHYYASALKYLQKLFKTPEVLDVPPEEVIPDID